MGEHYPCNTSLSLGRRGFADASASMNWGRRGCDLQEQPLRFNFLFPPCSKEDEDGDGSKLSGEELDATSCRLRLWTADPEEDVVGGGGGGGGGHAESNGAGGKKKLRLSKEQLALLELYFRQQNTLNATQKQELAERLNLRPRQVEVWFQNKRARTKLKQTEVDCEFLKKCCESLSDENQRLKEELRELRSSKQGSPFYINLPETAARPSTMRPSCERLAASDGGARCLNDVDTPARGNPRSRVVPSNTSSMAFMGGLRQKFQ